MKVFVAEYIIMYEVLDFDFFFEKNLGVYYHASNYMLSVHPHQDRFAQTWSWFYTDISHRSIFFLRKKPQLVHEFVCHRRSRMYNFLFRVQAPWYMKRKWFSRYTWWYSYRVPMAWRFVEYQHLNMTVKHFFQDPIKLEMFLIEPDRLEFLLIKNLAWEHFPKKFVYYFEHPRSFWRKYFYYVFYKPQPYLREFLTDAGRYYDDHVISSVLNPHHEMFGGVLEHYNFTRKWIHNTWNIYNSNRPWGFSQFYAFRVGNYFTEVFSLRSLHYRDEFYTDSMRFLGSIIGTAENLRWHVSCFYYCFVGNFIFYWYCIYFVYKKDRRQLLHVFSLFESLPYWSKLYTNVLAYLMVFENHEEKVRRSFLKLVRIKLKRKSQIENPSLNKFKHLIFRPFAVWFLNKIVFTNIYRAKVRKQYLGKVDDYDIGKSYMYPVLLMLNIPFYFYFYIKGLIYSMHQFYYFTLTKWIKFTSMMNARNSFWFTHFFFEHIVVRREVEDIDAWETIERILNYIHLYGKKEYRDKVREDLRTVFSEETSGKGTRRNMEDYWAYYYYRTFGDYNPESEAYFLLKMRYLTRLFYYYTNFTMDFLITHKITNFFNFFSSPLHIRDVNTGVLNFHFFTYFAKPYVIFSYYHYYIYYLILTFDINNFYIDVLLRICYRSIFSVIKFFKYWGALNWKTFRSISRVWIYVIYNFIKYHFFLVRYVEFVIYFFFVSIYYFFVIIFNIVKWYFIYFVEIIVNFFFNILTNDFGLSYKFWSRYYMFRFYFIEYNIFVHIYRAIIQFFFNFVFILICFFVLTTLPFFKDILSDDFLIYFINKMINLLFDYNKLIYFNEVLDNWWVPYFDHGKFVKYYNGYYNYFEIRFKKLFNGWLNEITHLGRRKYRYRKFFHDRYFKRYYFWLRFNADKNWYRFFRWLVPGSFPWEIYIRMSFYFYIARHPARHFMPDVFWNTLPLMVTYLWIYKYHIFVSKIFVPLYWFWKYSYSYVLFTTLSYFHGTMFFNFFFDFFKYWYSFYFKLNYAIFYFSYNYYFNFLFMYSKTMRYYFITYDFLGHFWIYRSARFFIALDIFEFFRFSLDIIYFTVVGFCYKFFYYIFQCIYYVFNIIGLTSMTSYLNFSMTIIPHFQSFFTEWFDKFITLHYEVDEYGRILYKHFRNYTRPRQGFKHVRNIFKRTVSFTKFRSTKFEVLFREFLYYNKRGLMDNFLIHNNIRKRNFNLVFFSVTSLYLNYFSLLLVFSWFSIKVRRVLRNDLLQSFSPFFEWNRFNSKEIRHSMGRDEFYWLYNIRWLKRFEFYIDKMFVDDVYTAFNRNDIRMGGWLYYSLLNVFVEREAYVHETAMQNPFLLYKRYYLERYITIVKNVDFIFHEYAIKNEKTKYMIFHYNNFFLPIKDRSGFDVYKNMVKELNYLDFYWLFFATPQMFYNRGIGFYRAMARDDVSKEVYQKIKKTLFKAYAFFESHDEEIKPFDLFEFQFFDLDTYDDFLFENFMGDLDYNEKRLGRYLHRVSRSRFNAELAYALPSKNLSNLFFYIGYADWINRVEYFFDYLRSFNEDVCDNMLDLGIYTHIEPLYIVDTNVTANKVKESVDLYTKDDVIGVRYKELYKYEELGKVATENHIYQYIDSVFTLTGEDELTRVGLTDDHEMSTRLVSGWIALLIILPAVTFAMPFFEYCRVAKWIEVQVLARELLYRILTLFFSIYTAEEVLFHGLLTWEHDIYGYWFNPLIWIRTFCYDFYWIDRYSHWEGDWATFSLSKEFYVWKLLIMDCEEMRYDDFTWLQRSFYIFAWEKDPKTVIPFLFWEIVMYALFSFSSVMILHGVMYSWDLCRYFVKEPNLVLDKDYTVEDYLGQYVKKERGKTFFGMTVKELFPKFEIDDHKYSKKRKKKKK